MKFSTRVSYGLRALIRLAKNSPEGLSLGSIAKQERISAKYLESIFSDFKKAGIIKSVQGAHGGYQLIKKPSALSMLDIVSAVENPTETLYCVSSGEKKYCGASCSCGVKVVVNELNKSVKQTLNKIKLSELIK